MRLFPNERLVWIGKHYFIKADTGIAQGPWEIGTLVTDNVANEIRKCVALLTLVRRPLLHNRVLFRVLSGCTYACESRLDVGSSVHGAFSRLKRRRFLLVFMHCNFSSTGNDFSLAIKLTLTFLLSNVVHYLGLARPWIITCDNFSSFLSVRPLPAALILTFWNITRRPVLFPSLHSLPSTVINAT